MAFLRKQRDKETTVPTDSLSDIAFLLIIFFILTTSIRRLTGFTTEFPSGERSEAQQVDKSPTINLNDGTVRFNDENVGMDDLRRRIAALRLDLKEGDRKVVMLEATGRVHYQQYYEVMSIVSLHGGVVGVVSEDSEGAE